MNSKVIVCLLVYAYPHFDQDQKTDTASMLDGKCEVSAVALLE